MAPGGLAITATGAPRAPRLPSSQRERLGLRTEAVRLGGRCHLPVFADWEDGVAVARVSPGFPVQGKLRR